MIEQIILKVDEVSGRNKIDIKLPKNDKNIDSVIQILENLKLKPVVEKPDTQLPEETVEEVSTAPAKESGIPDEKIATLGAEEKTEDEEQEEKPHKGRRGMSAENKKEIVDKFVEVYEKSDISKTAVSEQVAEEFGVAVVTVYNIIKAAGKWPEKKKEKTKLTKKEKEYSKIIKENNEKKEIESNNSDNEETEICEKYKNFKLGANLKGIDRLSNTHISRWIDMLYNAVEYGSLTLLDVKELEKHFPKEIYKFIGSKMEEILKELGVKNVNVEYKRNEICFESGSKK